MQIDQSSTVTAVIVAYCPDPDRLRALLASVVPQVLRTVVVDNGSPAATLAVLRELRVQFDVELIELGRNCGIAAAHNTGIRRAMQGRQIAPAEEKKSQEAHREKNAETSGTTIATTIGETSQVRQANQANQDFVLLLDHDSVLAPDCVAALLAAHRRLSDSGVKVGAVGPRYVDQTSGAAAPFLRYTRWDFYKTYPRDIGDVIEASVLISSGSLIAIAAFEAVGPMDETLFIDCVDWDWCFRAGALGHRLFGIAAAAMMHTLGDSGIRIFNRKIPLHSPLRHYYAYRNAILLCKRSTVPFSWKLHFTARLAVRFAVYMVCSPQRAERCRYIVRGLADGFKGRAGPYQPG